MANKFPPFLTTRRSWPPFAGGSASSSTSSVNQLVCYTSGIASESATGTTGALLPINGTGSTQTLAAFTVFINAEDCTRYISNPSISISMQLGSNATASFEVIQEFVNGIIISAITPDVRQKVLIHHNTSGSRLFFGQIESVESTRLSGTAGAIVVKVNCADLSLMTTRRAIASWDSINNSSYAPIIGRAIVDSYLSDYGIGFDGVGPVGENVGSQFFNWITVSEVFRKICDTAGLDWRIDTYGLLKFIDRLTGYESAPFSITQNNGLWRSLSSGKNMGKYANRVIVRNSRDLGGVSEETQVVTATGAYSPLYPRS